VGGVGLGVAALIVVLAVLDGFETNLKTKLLGLSPHISIYRAGGNLTEWPSVASKIKTIPGVKTALPFIQGQVMASSASGASGVVLMGLDPKATEESGLFETLALTPNGAKNLTQRPMIPPEPNMWAPGALAEEGYLADDVEAEEPLEPEPQRALLLGRELALTIGAGIFSQVRLIAPLGRVTPLGQRAPISRFFTVAGTFQANYYDFDSKLAFTTLDEAADLLGLEPGEVTYIEVKVEDIYQADRIHAEIIRLLGPDYWGRDWMQLNLSLFSALKLERTAMFVILTLIILVAAFNIASTLIMMVAEKTRDIAILKAMGATSAQIRRIFTIQGLWVGLVGTLGGLLVGVTLCLLLRRYEFISLPPEIYLMSSLPVELRWPQVLAITVVSLVISYLATVYPASRAAKFDPVESLRYE
jgi:lipoprotein-releasing system permease protein